MAAIKVTFDARLTSLFFSQNDHAPWQKMTLSFPNPVQDSIFPVSLNLIRLPNHGQPPMLDWRECRKSNCHRPRPLDVTHPVFSENRILFFLFGLPDCQITQENAGTHRQLRDTCTSLPWSVHLACDATACSDISHLYHPMAWGHIPCPRTILEAFVRHSEHRLPSWQEPRTTTIGEAAVLSTK